MKGTLNYIDNNWIISCEDGIIPLHPDFDHPYYYINEYYEGRAVDFYLVIGYAMINNLSSPPPIDGLT